MRCVSTKQNLLRAMYLAHGDEAGWGTVLPAGRSRIRFIAIGIVHYGPGVDSASKRCEYQEYF